MSHPQQIAQLEQVVEDLLHEARQQGADAAEAGVSAQTGLSVTVRLGETEKRNVQTAAVVKVKLGRLIDDRLGFGGRPEIEAAGRHPADQ